MGTWIWSHQIVWEWDLGSGIPPRPCKIIWWLPSLTSSSECGTCLSTSTSAYETEHARKWFEIRLTRYCILGGYPHRLRWRVYVLRRGEFIVSVREKRPSFTMTKVVFDPLRFKLLYFFMYGGLGILAPYVPVFFERLLMSKSQIGVLLMIPSISSFIFAPVWSLFCDRLDVRSEVMFFTLIMSEILTFSMYFFDAFLSMALVVLVGSVVKAPFKKYRDIRSQNTESTIHKEIQ